MAYETELDYNYYDLTQETKYRFAEIELKYAMDGLTKLFMGKQFPRQQAVTHLYEMITLEYDRKEEKESNFHDTLVSNYFNNIRKSELTLYFRYRGCSYQKIREMSGVSPNTIAKLKFEKPEFFPVYKFWDAPTLNQWDKIKPALNIFNEELIHTN